MSLRISVAGRFAQKAAAGGEGEVCAAFRRSFYLRFAGERYACVGDASLGRGPLNAIADEFNLPAIGDHLALSTDGARIWSPPALPAHAAPELKALKSAARGRVPAEGLGCLVVDAHNQLSGHAQPALDAVERWLIGNALEEEAATLIGLGPGLTPSGDDYLGGVLIALHHLGRKPQAQSLWRWLQPRLPRTNALSAAHLAAAAAGEGHEALHHCLAALCTTAPDWRNALERLDKVGHCSGWDALAGVAAVGRSSD